MVIVQILFLAIEYGSVPIRRLDQNRSPTAGHKEERALTCPARIPAMTQAPDAGNSLTSTVNQELDAIYTLVSATVLATTGDIFKENSITVYSPANLTRNIQREYMRLMMSALDHDIDSLELL